ncbi:hypothetical protein AWV80_04545 [Cupriavidus sp. UYMU48A]|nr:hypothetical protein AWV80_04545 [Cupriavidus sp. UYMU48A]
MLRGFEFLAFAADIAGIVKHLQVVGRHARERAPDRVRALRRTGASLVAQHTGVAAEADQHGRPGFSLRVRTHHIEYAPRVASLAVVRAATPDGLQGHAVIHYCSIHFSRRPSVSGTISSPISDTRPQPIT